MKKIQFKNKPNTDTPINDDNLNLLQENVEEAIEEKAAYLSEEQVIGTWMGKPLYRKTISFNDTISASYPIEKEHNISNVSYIFIDTAHSFVMDISNNNSIPLPTPCSDGNFDDEVGVQVDATKIKMYARTTWNTGWIKVVTVNYTKTTD